MIPFCTELSFFFPVSMEKLRSFKSTSQVHPLHRANPPSHPIEERQNLLKETPIPSVSNIGSQVMNATDGT